MPRYLWLLSLAMLLMPVDGICADAANTTKTDKTNTQIFSVPVVAIVDVQRIMQESMAAKNIQKQLETQRAKFQTEIAGEESSLRHAEEDLAKSRDSLTPDIFADREQQLRQKYLVVERHVQAKRKALDQAFNDSMNNVKKSLFDIVASHAHAHGVNLVIVKQQTLWSDKALDITDEVLSQLNKTLLQVPVKVQAEEDGKQTP